MSPDPAPLSKAQIGRDFWGDDRLTPVVDSLVERMRDAGHRDPVELLRLRALVAAEETARDVLQERIQAIRDSGVTWDQVALSLDLTRPSTLGRYNTKSRRSAAERQQRYTSRTRQHPTRD